MGFKCEKTSSKKIVFVLLNALIRNDVDSAL